MNVWKWGLVVCLYRTLSSALLGRNFELERMEALCSEVFRLPPPAFSKVQLRQVRSFSVPEA